MTVLSNKKVKTRKAHTCFACLRDFPKGTLMNSQVNTFDGIQTVYSCVVCDELISSFGQYFDDGSGVFESGCVDEGLDENLPTPEKLLEHFKSNNYVTKRV